jgi:hypothetical protein
MHFASPPPPRPQRDPGLRLGFLLLCAGVAALATRWPWSCVRFERLFGAHFGPPGWQSSAGFTCLMTSLMVGALALAESGSPSSRRAVRPGSLLLAAVACAALAATAWRGPGSLGGVTAAWTIWFFVGAIGMVALFVLCMRRWVALRALPRA